MTVKRSLAIRGHRTSISIEDEFWTEFRNIASRKRLAVAALVADVDAGRGSDVNLSSAIRLFVLADLVARVGAEAAPAQDDDSRIPAPVS